MKHLIKSLRSLSLIFTIVILWSACGSDSSTQEATVNNSTEITTPVDSTTAKSSDVDTAKPAEPDAEKKEEAKEELVKTAIEKPKEAKKEVKKVPKKRAKMHFPEKVFDYGFIMQGDIVKHDFHFKNIGNDDLLIKRVDPSCGCTVPIYPKEPVAPGEEGKISVTFKSAGKLGRQVPHIKVLTNYERSIKLELKGFVDAEREKPRQVIEEKKDTTQQ